MSIIFEETEEEKKEREDFIIYIANRLEFFFEAPIIKKGNWNNKAKRLIEYCDKKELNIGAIIDLMVFINS